MSQTHIKQEKERLKKLQKTKTELSDNFNGIAMMMISHLASHFPDSYFGTYKMVIEGFFKLKPDEPIAKFTKHVYANDVFRRKIKEGDETFFMNQDFGETIGTQGMSLKIFQFKELWVKSDDATKEIIKKLMLMMIERCETYISNLKSINTCKKIINGVAIEV